MQGDPDSEALIWKLHRELNGLRGDGATRPRLNGIDRVRRQRGKPASESQDRDSQRHRDRSDDEQVLTSKRIKQEVSDNDSEDLPRKQHHQRPRPQHRLGRTTKPPVSDGSASDDHGAHHGALVVAPAGQLGKPPPRQTHHASPVEAAAEAACAVVQRRVQQQALRSSHSRGPRSVKVFHAGVRWGVALPRKALRSRQDLARALNEALAGQITSAGRGDALSVTFVNRRGAAAELSPPCLAGASVDSAAQWRALSSAAVRVYVRPAVSS